MAKIIGLVNLHSDVSLGGLTERRPAASVSFLGRYGIIDIVLSNLSNSGIDTVGVLIKEKPRSLFKHLGNGNAWNFNSKKGGVSFLYNEGASGPYNHDVNNLIENIAFLDKNTADYVVIAPAHIITTMNFADLVDEHEKSGAEVSVVYKKIKDGKEAFIGEDIVKVEDGVVTGFDVNKGNRKNTTVSLNTYIFNKDALYKVLKKAQKASVFFDLRDTLNYMVDEAKINAVEFKGFAANINSFETYYDTCMKFLDRDVNTAVFKSNWPIFTNTNDTPPAKYLKNSSVKNSFVANGVICDGEIQDSIIGREVTIGKGAVIKNSIIFSGAKIGNGAVLDHVIVDKEAKIKRVTELVGTAEKPLYVKEGDTV
ncbi:MAG: glucose-1-phosphate adenylyltransferase subunit GlgD [Erysipelotrichaceae bacterium]|nr:glucose-1-phosphate adenylyltransferase subunit GlgD [Erysipelotrichaceae bacterium]